MTAEISGRDLERVSAARAHLEAGSDSRTADRAEHHLGELLGVIARLTQPPALPSLEELAQGAGEPLAG